MIIPGYIILKMRNIFKKVKEKIKTHILCSINTPLENLAVYEIMWGKYG
jgi:hypothetical protein